MGDHPAISAQQFASDITELVCSVMHGSSEFRAMRLGNLVQISVFDEAGEVQDIPLFIGGNRVASWRYTMSLGLDHVGEHLKVLRSNFSLRSDIDKTPLVRYEFDDMMRTAPVAHWQFHGERGAFSHLLGIAQGQGVRAVKPYSLSSLHFPVGGARMRAGLEDILEFLISECHFDKRGGWKGALQESRRQYRLIQARTITRDAQHEVADALRSLGWMVTPPDDDPGPIISESMVRW